MWRVVDIAEQDRWLHLHRSALVVNHDNHELGRVPIADIQSVIVHGAGCGISLNLAAALAEAGVPLVLCSSNHMPSSITLPVTGNFESAQRLSFQANTSVTLRKRLWQELVRAKITAQSQALAATGHGDHVSLIKFVATVASGDPKNVEAQAARYYWQRMMGKKFRRDVSREGLNSSLNYGYTILRSMVARSIVASGLSPGLGLHHHARLNTFQLVDVLMEPFRPLVDLRVWRHRDEWANGLSREGKIELAAIVMASLATADAHQSLPRIIDRVIMSLVEIYSGERKKLWFPDDFLEAAQGGFSFDEIC